MTPARYTGLDTQKLWTCTWGTMTALVWAQSEETAELRVRHGMFRRRATLQEVLRQPVLVRGDVLVREATDEDRERYTEAGGKMPA